MSSVRGDKEDPSGTEGQHRQCQCAHPDDIGWHPFARNAQGLPGVPDPLGDQDEHGQGHQDHHRNENGHPIEIRPPQQHRGAHRQGDGGPGPGQCRALGL
ncbi:hypothetical protein [Corynebacterium efficiens YS-314]|uniref:Uncharacterized protein n=1 Tax=Corynebacterium efficiens (strain DSM 44549 / YS-314 / AJ 12310 / JCM 11189 / NBRC 100395) TaxID=196164 RepID=Q8FUB2_COREF|nr:hypothetical protein [Corynebacterium efficiens YS-314]